MTKRVFDKQGNSYTLADKLGSGGEGVVYRCAGSEDIVAKIYHEQMSAEKEEKLLWMAENQNKQLLKFAAWVVAVIYDKPDGKPLGFLMPSVKAKEIHELYSPKSRRTHFPNATWHFLIHTATNVARAFYCLHSANHVMGDVNHGNCVVLADGTVKLIDCDSFGILPDKERYKVDVGVMSYLAPELHRKELSTTERTAEQDNFGLAVMIFQLLFLGRHPFAGNIERDVDLSLEECIEKYLFAYGKDARKKKLKRPPATLSLGDLPPDLAALFERAFAKDTQRPEPAEWVKALEDLADNLKQCIAHTGHQYPGTVAGCPFCRIETQTGVTMFPFIYLGGDESRDGSFDLVTIEKMLDKFEKVDLSILASDNLPEPQPSQEVYDLCNEQRIAFVKICASYAGIVFAMSLLNSPGAGILIAFVLIVPFIIMVQHFNRNSRGTIVDELNEAELEVKNLESQFHSGSLSMRRRSDVDLAKSKLKMIRKLSSPTASLKALPPGKKTEHVNLVSEINYLMHRIQTIDIRTRKELEVLAGTVRKKLERIGQLRANNKMIGSGGYAVVFLIASLFLLPGAGEIVRSSFRSEIKEPSVGSKDIRESIPSKRVSQLLAENSIPPMSTSDYEIGQLSPSERSQLSAELFALSNTAIMNNRDRETPLLLLEHAIRFEETSDVLMNLGILQYEAKKYGLCIGTMDRLVEINPKVEQFANYYRGLSYLETGENIKAKSEFELLSEASRSSHDYFKLGEICNEMNDFECAIMAFRNSVKYDNKHMEAVYELAVAYRNVENDEGFREQYEILRKSEPGLARKLDRNTKPRTPIVRIDYGDQ